MVFVVAEIGVNWKGDFELVREMMQKAKLADCNAVKFQAFNEDIIKEHPDKMNLMKSSISTSNVEMINTIAKSVGIEWFCTPMYPDAVELLDPYVKRFKIRVADSRPILENKKTDIFEKILKTGKEVFISSEVSPKGKLIINNPQIKWLYCVSKYPCNLEDLDFGKLNEFDGYSNHCPNTIAPLTACILGSEILEVHITSDKSKNFVDNNVSFDYNELTGLIKSIRFSEKIKR